MSVRACRSGFLAPMLAFLAVIVMGGLSGWHGAAFHDDEPVFALSFEHVHGGARQDSDSAIHLAAHAVVQGTAIPAYAAAPPAHPVIAMAWPAGESPLRTGADPASLLRPPQG